MYGSRLYGGVEATPAPPTTTTTTDVLYGAGAYGQGPYGGQLVTTTPAPSLPLLAALFPRRSLL